MGKNVHKIFFSGKASYRKEGLTDCVLDLFDRKGLTLTVSLDDGNVCAAHIIVF
jgi:hypothetical protein